MPYELRTLGGLDLSGPDGASVDPMLAHSKGMALLAILAVDAREEPVSRSDVAALLWPNRSEERAQNALRITLTRIRQDADPALVEGKREATLRMNPDVVEVDWWALEDARSAGDDARLLDTYRGHFLEGFRLSGVAPFERWADRHRESARDAAHDAALAVAGEARERGELARAVEAYRQATELRPLREEAVQGLILSLAEDGRTAEAIRRYRRFRERRREELGLEPPEELETLVERIRAGELSEGPPSAEPPELPAARETPADPAGSRGERDRRTPEEPVEGARSRKRPLAAVLTLVLAALAGWIAWQALNGDGAAAGNRGQTVAVLPFTPIGTAGETGVFADGLHSDLVTRLSGASALTVISSTSVQRFRDRDLPLPTIADTLGARWVLEGEVQQVGDRIAVNVQLIDPRTDTHAWAESFRRELTADNYFALQDDISGRVVEVLEARVGGELAHRRRQTGDLDAYRHYVRGRSLLEQRDPPQMEKSLAYFDHALRADSSYALAWAGRANALSILARYPGFGSDTLLPRADTAVRRALELDPELAEAHAARGRLHMYRREGPRALRAFGRAIELRPSFAEAWAWLAKLQLSLGMAGEALASAERAAELDPLSTENLGTLSWAYLADGDPERALAVGRRVTELQQDAEGPSVYARIALAHVGRVEELRRATYASDLDAESAPLLAAELPAATGDSSAARDWLHRLDDDESPFLRAWMHAALGRPDTALAVLRRHYPRRDRPWDPPYTIYLRYFWTGTLGEVRALPAYDSLLREVNVTWGLNPDGSLPGS